MDKCYYCGAKLKEEQTDIIRYWGKEPFALNNVPTLICENCGERYYTAKVSKKIDRIILDKKSLKKTQKILEVPVFNWQ